MFRKLAVTLISGAIVVGAVNTGIAGIYGTAFLVANPPGIPFRAPDAALPAPWVSYQFNLSTTAGELIGAVDVTVNGNKLHQCWNDTDFDGVTNSSPQSPVLGLADGRADSRLTAPTGSPFGLGPSETNTLAGSPLVSTPGVTEYGVGNLSGAWAILTPGTTATIAYLVFKADYIPTLDIQVKAAQPNGTPLFSVGEGSATLTIADFFLPEPSAMVLMGLAMLGSLGYFRRRRHSVE